MEILAHRHGFQMLWIAALFDAAEMVNMEP